MLCSKIKKKGKVWDENLGQCIELETLCIPLHDYSEAMCLCHMHKHTLVHILMKPKHKILFQKSLW